MNLKRTFFDALVGDPGGLLPLVLWMAVVAYVVQRYLQRYPYRAKRRCGWRLLDCCRHHHRLGLSFVRSFSAQYPRLRDWSWMYVGEHAGRA